MKGVIGWPLASPAADVELHEAQRFGSCNSVNVIIVWSATALVAAYSVMDESQVSLLSYGWIPSKSTPSFTLVTWTVKYRSYE
jgi:hypothetical protein